MNRNQRAESSASRINCNFLCAFLYRKEDEDLLDYETSVFLKSIKNIPNPDTWAAMMPRKVKEK